MAGRRQTEYFRFNEELRQQLRESRALRFENRNRERHNSEDSFHSIPNEANIEDLNIMKLSI
jgi:hypothetical protein